VYQCTAALYQRTAADFEIVSAHSSRFLYFISAHSSRFLYQRTAADFFKKGKKE